MSGVRIDQERILDNYQDYQINPSTIIYAIDENERDEILKRKNVKGIRIYHNQKCPEDEIVFEDNKLVSINIRYNEINKVDKFDIISTYKKNTLPQLIKKNILEIFYTPIYIENLIVLKIDFELDEDFCRVLRKLKKLTVLNIKRGLNKETNRISPIFLESLLYLKNIINFAFTNNDTVHQEDISKMIDHLPQTLLCLTFEENNLTSFPDKLEKFQNLIALNIGNNCMETIPQSIMKLKYIEFVDATSRIDHKGISYIPLKLLYKFQNVKAYIGLRNGNRIIERAHKMTMKDLKNVCDCYLGTVQVDDNRILSLKDICYEKLPSNYDKNILPKCIMEEIETFFLCDFCDNIRVHHGHKCNFHRMTATFGDPFSDTPFSLYDVVVFTRTKICKYCYSKIYFPYFSVEELF
uniref:Leucine-rich repeat containing protein n=1 Tax=Parastrongyloides trichosuri TaxID=131310 RepID=A0A0N4ZYD7_PARTI